MIKNVLIGLLAVCCVLLAVNVQRQTSALNRLEDQPLSPAEYGGLVALRDVLSPEQYQAEILPLLQKVKEGGVITMRELRELADRLPDLGRQTLEAAEKPRAQEAIMRAWENTRQEAANLGDRLGRSMGDALDELARRLEEATRPKAAPRTAPDDPAPQSDALTEI